MDNEFVIYAAERQRLMYLVEFTANIGESKDVIKGLSKKDDTISTFQVNRGIEFQLMSSVESIFGGSCHSRYSCCYKV